MFEEPLESLAHEPLYLKLKEQLLEKIRRGQWKSGDKLPVESELALQSGVSIGTVRKAVQLLVNNGVLIKRQGSGTFVRSFKSQGYYNQFQPFSSIDGKPRYNKRKLVLYETIPASQELAFSLGIPEKTPLRHIVRHMIKGDKFRERIVAIDELFLIPTFFPGLSQRVLEENFRPTDSLYKFYDREFGLVVTNQKCSIQYEELSEDLAEALMAPVGMQVLRMARISMAYGRTPVGFRINRMSVENLKLNFDLS